MEIVLATTNEGKVREIRHALEGAAVTLVALNDIAATLEVPEETGLTFADNAALKARYYAERTGRLTLAEDSGLSIDALGGRPGVLSARYPGDTYPDKFERMYGELAHRPRPWTARYTCAIALADRDGRLRYSVAATVEGEIAPAPRGVNGFGYDPIFFFPPFGCTTGEMTDAQKLGISHRGKAFRTFRDWLAHPNM
jgi:XTP/dITP diphosphohydrolase